MQAESTNQFTQTILNSNGTEAVGQQTIQSSSVDSIAETIVQNIPEPPAIPISSAVEEVVIQLAANGEPTLKSLGLGSWWPSGLVQQALEFLHCTVGLPWWGAIALGKLIRYVNW